MTRAAQREQVRWVKFQGFAFGEIERYDVVNVDFIPGAASSACRIVRKVVSAYCWPRARAERACEVGWG
jgi:hypothetical protein